MSKETARQTNGTVASRPADVPTIINVVREVARAHRNGNHETPHTTDDDRRVRRELSDTIRESFIPDRLAETMVHRFERVVGHEIRELLRVRLARELRGALRDAAIGVADQRRTRALLSNRVSDAIEERVRVTLTEGFPAVLRDRLPAAVHAAIAETAFAAQNDGLLVDDFVDRVLAIAETAIRQRLHDGLRGVLRNRVADVARERLSEAVQTVAGKRADDGDADRIAASLGGEIEAALHDRALTGVMARFRAIVANSVHEAIGERMHDVLAHSVRGGNGRGAARSNPSRADRGSGAGTLDRLASTIEGPIAEEVIRQIADGLHERVDAALRSNLSDTLRDRLPGAIRLAVLDQASSDVVNLERLADMIHYELAEIMRARVCDGIRARTAEAVRGRLRDAIRSGIARTAAS
jgi:hypothetical protein